MYKHLKYIYIILLCTVVIIGLPGCVAVWGAPYKIEFKSRSSITFSYDPMMANWGEVQNIAQAHCDQYDKDAVVHKQTRSDWGLMTVDYTCKNRGKEVKGENDNK